MDRWRIFVVMAAFFVFSGIPLCAQNSDPPPSPSSQPQDVPPNAAARGTRFLVALQTRISTKEDKSGKQIFARTLEPIPTSDGSMLPAGVQVRGHIDKVQSAGKVGRARLWLTFDDIHTASGWTPLVADLIDAPGTHSIRVLFDREGEIEAPSSKRDDEMLAMAEAAFVGAEPGAFEERQEGCGDGGGDERGDGVHGDVRAGAGIDAGAEYEIGVGARAAAVFREDLKTSESVPACPCSKRRQRLGEKSAEREGAARRFRFRRG